MNRPQQPRHPPRRASLGCYADPRLSTTRISADWSPWQPLAGVPILTPDVLAEILDGGQAFRWHRVTTESEQTGSPPGSSASPSQNPRNAAGPALRTAAPEAWAGVWNDNIARLRLAPGGILEWSAPAALHERVGPALGSYFATAGDWYALTDALPWRSDAHLARCLADFRGLRILHQPFGEALLGFLCSATKQIVQIKQMVALLAARHGAPLAENSALSLQLSVFSSSPSEKIHRLPTWAELARISEAELRACLLGFRAGYIARTARFLAERPGWLEETEALPYPAAKARLCELPGVGEKVADCVLLFGAGRLEAFPVDVWILKTLARRYGLDGWRPSQLAQFGRAHFGPLAGLAQQYLFAWEREFSRRENPA